MSERDATNFFYHNVDGHKSMFTLAGTLGLYNAFD